MGERDGASTRGLHLFCCTADLLVAILLQFFWGLELSWELTLAKITNIQKRRKLSELFERGGEIRFNADGVNEGDPTPDDIVIWVRPPNPLERDMAIRDASATRARATLAAKRDPEADDEAVASKAAIQDLSLTELIDFLLDSDESELTAEAQRNILDREEWKDFEALRDSVRQWEEAGFPDTDEWKEVEERDSAFGAQVRDEVVRLRVIAGEGLGMLDRSILEKKALDKRIETLGNQAFMRTYQEHMLYYACRDGDDKSLHFFENVNEMLSMPDEVQRALADKLASFINNPVDAKNSPRADRSSDSSVPPGKQEISEVSGPDGVTE